MLLASSGRSAFEKGELSHSFLLAFLFLNSSLSRLPSSFSLELPFSFCLSLSQNRALWEESFLSFPFLLSTSSRAGARPSGLGLSGSILLSMATSRAGSLIPFLFRRVVHGLLGKGYDEGIRGMAVLGLRYSGGLRFVREGGEIGHVGDCPLWDGLELLGFWDKCSPFGINDGNVKYDSPFMAIYD